MTQALEPAGAEEAQAIQQVHEGTHNVAVFAVCYLSALNNAGCSYHYYK